jgi:hypothetical protein
MTFIWYPFAVARFGRRWLLRLGDARGGPDRHGLAFFAIKLSMKLATRRILRIFLGVLFLLLGVAGLFRPVLQGWLFIGIGALLLSPEIKPFHSVLQWLEKRYPKIGKKIQRFREKYLKEEPSKVHE